MKANFLTFPKSEEFELWIHNGISASDSAILMGENPWETYGQLLARKSELTPVSKPVTAAMERGRALRPTALAAYRRLMRNPNLKPACASSKIHTQLIAHIDLFDHKSLHAAEVHCGETALRKALGSGKLPKPYWAEAQHTLYVLGLKFLRVYIHGDQAGQESPLSKVHASPTYQTKMVEAELAFLKAVGLARAQKQKEALRAKDLLKTQAALKGTGPKVPEELYRQFVPYYVSSQGNLTSAGKTLLMPEAALTA
jgi:predicted phage-related endonuclease